MRPRASVLAAVLALGMAGPSAPAAQSRPAAVRGTDEMANSSRFITDAFSLRHNLRPQIALSGAWEFRRDPDGAGEAQGWHEGKGEFEDTVRVPGAPQAQGFGEPTERQQTAFTEPFWVRRTFALPELDSNERVWLRIGGIFPAAQVYVNGSYVGYTKSSRTQQRVDVTALIAPGAENLVAIKVCDLPEMRLDGIFEWGELGLFWSGVYRPVTCEITDRVSVIDAYVQPQLSTGSVRVKVELSEASSKPLTLTIQAKDGERILGAASTVIPPGEEQAQAELELDDFTPWSPDHPQLYMLEMSLRTDEDANVVDRVGIRFGMRELTADARKFYLNGKPIFMRLYGENQYYPESLCPPADKEWYLARLRRAREYGMNGAKGCVESLPLDYIEAADEAGIMILQEMPFGLSALRANRYTIDESFRRYYASELDGLVRESRNHASVVAYSMSSELEFNNQTQESFDFFSRDLVLQTRRLAPHALVIDCTGYVDTEDTAKGKRETDFYASIIPTWMKKVLDETDPETDGLHPTILHEYNWWSCYPDPADRDKYAATQLKPFWLDKLVDTARANGQEELISTYHENSQWLQALCRKDGVEYTRRNPLVEGYILWLLVDFGPYCEGLFDDFWNPKNVSAQEYLQSNGDTVIVLAKDGDRCLELGGKQRIPLAVSHYGEQALTDCALRWRLVRGSEFQHGELRVPLLEQGELTQAGYAEFHLPPADKAYEFELEVALYHDGEVIATNEWSFWGFPEVGREISETATAQNAGTIIGDGVLLRLGADAPIAEETELVVADSLDDALADYVERGGKCLLFVHDAVIQDAPKSRAVHFYRTFRTIPWNAGNSGNSGTVIADHPALAPFPHGPACDLQFLSMINGVLPMEFDPLRHHGVTPIIRAIDHYAANRNNAYMLEFKVGRGKALATSFGVLPTLGVHVEARYLLDCLVTYAQGADFDPTANVPKEEFLRLFSQSTD